MTEIERMHEERINALDRRVDVLSQKIDDYIAESRAARAKTDEELKEMRAEMKTLNQRMDSTLKNFNYCSYGRNWRRSFRRWSHCRCRYFVCT